MILLVFALKAFVNFVIVSLANDGDKDGVVIKSIDDAILPGIGTEEVFGAHELLDVMGLIAPDLHDFHGELFGLFGWKRFNEFYGLFREFNRLH